MMITKFKPSQRLGAVPLDPSIWNLLIGIGTPPEKFLPTPLASSEDTKATYVHLESCPGPFYLVPLKKTLGFVVICIQLSKQ